MSSHVWGVKTFSESTKTTARGLLGACIRAGLGFDYSMVLTGYGLETLRQSGRLLDLEIKIDKQKWPQARWDYVMRASSDPVAFVKKYNQPILPRFTTRGNAENYRSAGVRLFLQTVGVDLGFDVDAPGLSPEMVWDKWLEDLGL